MDIEEQILDIQPYGNFIPINRIPNTPLFTGVCYMMINPKNGDAWHLMEDKSSLKLGCSDANAIWNQIKDPDLHQPGLLSQLLWFIDHEDGLVRIRSFYNGMSIYEADNLLEVTEGDFPSTLWKFTEWNRNEMTYLLRI